jgi:hypothetical protein
MIDFKTTTELVKYILTTDPKTRNSDSFLYLKVLTEIGRQRGIDIEKMSIPYFLLNLHGTAVPCFETVRRTRQKLQQHYPYLASSEPVKGFRTANEAEYRAFARSDV